MIMLILHKFNGYTIKTIMDTPFCHVIRLFQLAERVDAIDSLTAYTGKAAGYDKTILASLIEVKNSKIVRDKELYKSIVTEEAKRQVEKYGKSNS